MIVLLFFLYLVLGIEILLDKNIASLKYQFLALLCLSAYWFNYHASDALRLGW